MRALFRHILPQLVKPIFACVPSQKGLFDEPPQRHSPRLLRAQHGAPGAGDDLQVACDLQRPVSSSA